MLDTTGAYTRPAAVHDEDGPEAFISSGEALARALDSLGLELPPEPSRPRKLLRGLAWGVTLTLLCAGLAGAVHFMILALDAWDPTRIPQ